jgi:hypothetical protein
MAQSKSILRALAFVAAATCLLMLLYVGCYLLAGDVWWMTPNIKCRRFSSDWQAAVFRPAAKVESWIIGNMVSAITKPEP